MNIIYSKQKISKLFNYEKIQISIKKCLYFLNKLAEECIPFMVKVFKFQQIG